MHQWCAQYRAMVRNQTDGPFVFVSVEHTKPPTPFTPPPPRRIYNSLSSSATSPILCLLVVVFAVFRSQPPPPATTLPPSIYGFGFSPRLFYSLSLTRHLIFLFFHFVFRVACHFDIFSIFIHRARTPRRSHDPAFSHTSRSLYMCTQLRSAGSAST